MSQKWIFRKSGQTIASNWRKGKNWDITEYPLPLKNRYLVAKICLIFKGRRNLRHFLRGNMSFSAANPGKTCLKNQICWKWDMAERILMIKTGYTPWGYHGLWEMSSRLWSDRVHPLGVSWLLRTGMGENPIRWLLWTGLFQKPCFRVHFGGAMDRRT